MNNGTGGIKHKKVYTLSVRGCSSSGSSQTTSIENSRMGWMVGLTNENGVYSFTQQEAAAWCINLERF